MSEHPPETRAAGHLPAWRGWAFFVLTLAATFLVAALGVLILQRREEARVRPPLRPIEHWESDSSRWGQNFPREYDSFRRTAQDTSRTRHGGAFPRDYLAETPANVVLFAGYGFAKEYRQARGHMHALEDVTRTQRVGAATPATCYTCKSPDVLRLIDEMGPEKFYSQKFSSLGNQVKHPVGCLDCHEPETMRLRVARPALREAFQRQGRDLEQVSHQEMRSLVCAQCHVEYYFRGEGNYLTFPWDKGMSPEKIEEYYNTYDFADFTHAISKTRIVKMQHPDFEVYRAGIHAYRNVACADCHMPYRTEGGVKFTDHHIQSPLLNIANSCAVCHRWSEEEIRTRVETIQDKVREARDMAEKVLVRAHFDVAAAAQAGAGDEELAPARKRLGQAQMRWDYVAANNGMGFHAPQECMRTLAAAVDLGGECRVECARLLAKRGVSTAVKYPDVGSKEKAQALIQQFIDGKPPKLL